MCQIPPKILFIEDTRADALLMSEYLKESHIQIDAKVIYGLHEMNNVSPEYSTILIGSGVLLHLGSDEFYRMMDNLSRDIPVILFLEFEDEERYLITKPVKNLLCLSKPKCYTEIPDIIRKVHSFYLETLRREA